MLKVARLWHFFMDYGKSPVPQSPHFNAIMRKYDAVGKYISIRKFFRDCVGKVDQSITLRMWQGFMKKYNKGIQEKAQQIIDNSQNKELSEMQLEERSIKKILQIADISLEEVMQNPEILSSIPIKDRMGWLMGVMKARDSRMNVLIKKTSEDRKANMYEDIMKGAQYGAVEADEIPAEEGEFEEAQKKQEEVPKLEEGAVEDPITQDPPKKMAGETVEFKPEDL